MKRMKMHTAYAVVDKDNHYIGSKDFKRQAESICRFSQGDRVARVEIREVNADEMTDADLLDALEALPGQFALSYFPEGGFNDVPLRDQMKYLLEKTPCNRQK